MITDHTHIKINNGDIFTVRGFDNDKEIFAVPVYFVSLDGERVLGSLHYRNAIDEFADEYTRKSPNMVIDTVYGRRVKIRQGQINKIFDPFSDFPRIYSTIKNDDYRKVINALSRFVCLEDIGFIGSSLVNFSTKDSDLDVVVRGLENYRKLKNNFSLILKEIDASCSISRKQFNKSVEKYNELFNKEHNDFSCMIFNRWSTVHIPDKLFCKIRFTYDPKKDDLFYAPKNIETAEADLCGKVISDEGVNFMPRHFKVKTDDGEEYLVITYFWDYSFCVSLGDRVVINGSLDKKNKIMIIGDRKSHGIKFSSDPQTICKILE